MALRVLYRLVGCLGIGALVCAGYLYFRPPEAGQAAAEGRSEVVVEEPERVLNELAAGGEHELHFVVRNGTRRDVRIIGVGWS